MDDELDGLFDDDLFSESDIVDDVMAGDASHHAGGKSVGDISIADVQPGDAKSVESWLESSVFSAETPKKKKPLPWRTVLVAVLGLAVAVGLVLGVPRLISMIPKTEPKPEPSPTPTETTPAAAAYSTPAALPAVVKYGGKVLPSVDEDKPVWVAKKTKNNALGVVHMGVVDITGDTLTLTRLSDRNKMMSTKLKEKVTFVGTTTERGESFVWRTGDVIHSWAQGDPKPLSAKIPADAQVSVTGELMLVTSGADSWAFKGGKLVQIKTSDTVVAADENFSYVAVDIDVIRLIPYSGSAKEVTMKPPAEGMVPTGWVFAGRGMVTLLWGATPDARDVTLCVHDANTGEPTSAMQTTSSMVATWTRGQGGIVGTAGVASVALLDGRLQYSAPEGVVLSGAVDDIVRFSSADGPGYVVDGQPVTTDVNVVAANSTTVVVKTSKGDLQAYARTES